MPRNDNLSELIMQIAVGDKAAFRAFYFASAPKLFSVAMRILKDPGKSSEAVQDAYMQIWQNADLYESKKGMIEAWITNIVRFRAIDIARRDRTSMNYFVELPTDDELQSASICEVRSAPEDALTLRKCLRQISAEQRRALLDVHFQGYTSDELAQRYQAPVGTIKSRIRRGLMALRICMEQKA